MKNYQQWLQCQTYTAHIKVLTQLKQQQLSLKSSVMERRHRHSLNSRSISNLMGPYTLGMKSRHSSLQKIMKQKQKQKENIFIGNRIGNVNSALSKYLKSQFWGKGKPFVKKKKTVNNQYASLRASKFNDFVKMEKQVPFERKSKICLKFKFESIPFVGPGKLQTYWIQLVSGNQRVQSHFFSSQKMCRQEIKLSLMKKIKNNLSFILHCSRGLDYLCLGTYSLQLETIREKQGSFFTLVSSEDKRKMVTLTIQIEENFNKNNYERWIR